MPVVLLATVATIGTLGVIYPPPAPSHVVDVVNVTAYLLPAPGTPIAPNATGTLSGTCIGTGLWQGQAPDYPLGPPFTTDENLSCEFNLWFSGFHHNATSTTPGYTENLTEVNVSSPFARSGTFYPKWLGPPGLYFTPEMCGLYFLTPPVGGVYNVAFAVYYTWTYLPA